MSVPVLEDSHWTGTDPWSFPYTSLTIGAGRTWDQ